MANARFVMKLPDGGYRVLPGGEKLPFSHVSLQGAMEYCAWAGKSLPTGAQWEFAARYDPASRKSYAYPWGDRFDGKRARCSREECPVGPPRDPKLEPVDNRPAPIGSYDGTGEYGDGRSPWGLFDMAGNADEIVDDCVGSWKPCEGGPCIDPPRHAPHADGRCEWVTRGGDAMSDRRGLLSSDRGRWTSAGFRCARPSN